MQPFILERTQILPVTQEIAWEFFSNPGNLVHITPPYMKFLVISAQETRAYAGQIICYTVCPFPGIRVSWVTEITHLQPPFFFVDEQRFGPYRFWHHQHRFRTVRNGVEMRDTVHYLLPRMPFAKCLNRLVIAPRLEQIFDFRRDTLQKMFS